MEMNKYNQVVELIITVFEAYEYLYKECKYGKIERIETSIFTETNMAVKAIEGFINKNPEFIGIIEPPILDETYFKNIDENDKLFFVLGELKDWLCLAKQVLHQNPIDIDFMKMINNIRKVSVEELFNHIKDNFLELPLHIKKELERFFSDYGYWGIIDESKNDFTVLMNRANALHEHGEDLLWLYGRLEDYRSRMTLLAIIKNWYKFDVKMLQDVHEHLFEDYFDMDIIKCGTDEVFVDLGAYVGDTIIDYVQTYGFNYKRIYCYEMTHNTFKILQENLKEFPNIIYKQKGVSDKKDVMYIKKHENQSANILHSEGNFAVETVSIDDDIDEPVTFIKMDIEGAEQHALHGCKEHIRSNKPKLAISVYHKNEDIWKIPRLIDEIMPGYQFYLRYKGGKLTPSEITLLAVYPN